MKKIIKNITIEVLTGLHIGVGNDKIQIGGVDNAFIKDPITNLPYIPGSSLKGKLRCLLEVEGEEKIQDLVQTSFGPYSAKDIKTFTRFIFRDLKLEENDEAAFIQGKKRTEFKTEIKIDRNTGSATPGALRSTERVPPATKFQGQILIRYQDEQELNKLQELLNQAIKLLNNDYLGGSGSRGYGSIKVTLN